ncbi:larval cuticle protein A3A-like [Photinus pyralis]|uniref:larval cuticle protein A3A-like n=1 Tax=Photinus pyralis TaxID=7054 RepID=UPI00126753A6|nr:larval cuticle protein A3A-like [Photinus pyralis]
MKVIIIASILVAVNAGGLIAPLAPAPLLRGHLAPAPILRAAPIVAKSVAVADADFDPNPQYSYHYDIQDALTGDSKNHFETRNGDAVQGSYSLSEADGSRRIVEYTADPINGFNAVVHKEPAQVAYAAPVAKVAAPLAYAAPIAKAPLLHAIH